MILSEWLTFSAIVVALFIAFLPRIFLSRDNKKKKSETRSVVKENLEQLKKDLTSIIGEQGNVDTTGHNKQVIFSNPVFSKVSGYYFLFSDLLLPNLDLLGLSKYKETMNFFIHYKINLETIRKQESDCAGTGKLQLETVKKLLDYLENAINEFN